MYTSMCRWKVRRKVQRKREEENQDELREDMGYRKINISLHSTKSAAKKDKNKKKKKTSSSSSRSARPSLASVVAPLPSVPLLQQPWPRRLSLARLPPRPSSHDP